ncbi:sigma-54 dependent transcriptional regulator [bacterium]|nr:sigma-54 dependent transcriptional regulator [bacterium]
MSKPRLLVVDDELSMREFLQILFVKEGFDVVAAESGIAAVKKLADESFDVVLTDLKMPGMSGIEVLRSAKERNPDVAVIMITAYASPESVNEALDLGATDYVNKPFRVDDLKHVVSGALNKQQLVRENIRLKAELGSRYGYANIFGAHQSMREVYEMIKRVSTTRSNILILGETGTGKELVAKAIHFNSPRSPEPFVVVNCGAIPETLWESELFGHKRGSFTGAIADKRGLFQSAHKGTLFLDEVGEMPGPIQVKLLRAIQERTVMPVGAMAPEAVDVRIIAATNRVLEKEVEQGQFRQDLYYRLNVIAINIPPLRDRASDIPMLANYFLEKFATESGKDVRKISEEAMSILKVYDYPGNVRELENIMERAVTLTRTNIILPDYLPPRIRAHSASGGGASANLLNVPPDGLDLDARLADIERLLLTQALEHAGGVKTRAAQMLRVTFRSLRYRLQKLGMDDESETADDSEEAAALAPDDDGEASA